MTNLQNTEEARPRTPSNSSSAANNSNAQRASETEVPVITPAQWARQVLGIKEPFGFDHMPTVWG